MLKRLLDWLPFNGLKTALGLMGLVLGFFLGPDGHLVAPWLTILPAAIAHTLEVVGAFLASIGYLHKQTKALAASDPSPSGPGLSPSVSQAATTRHQDLYPPGGKR